MTERFTISDTPLRGLRVLQRKPREDDRGWLERMYDLDELAELLDSRTVVQVNRTLTRMQGAVRGLHFQVPPSAETKIVSCLRGEIFDVAVDVRRASPTFLQWHGAVLTAENRLSLFVPEGFAHGIQSLVGDTEILYFTTAAYDPTAERGLRPTDARLGISWPLPIGQLSDRDASHPLIDAAFDGVPI